jgi:hypothetical protein
VSLLWWKYAVGFWPSINISTPISGRLTSCGNAERLLNVLQFFHGDPTRVRAVSGIRDARLQEANDVLGSEAVSHRSDALAAVFLLHLPDGGLDHGIHFVGRVLGAPRRHVEVWPAVERDGVPLEHVGHDGEEAVGRELVGDELRVQEAHAQDVGQDEDGVFGRLVRWIGEVRVNCVFS